MGAFFALLFTAAVYAFAGCPNPEEGVTHPDLAAIQAELERAPERAKRAVREAMPAKPKEATPRRSYREDRFGRGDL